MGERFYFDSRSAATPAQTSVSTSFKSMAIVTATGTGATLCRGRIQGIRVGGDGSYNSTDCQIVYALVKQTAAGTAVTATATNLDESGASARSACTINATAEGTYTSSAPVWSHALNQRASMQWVAPDSDSAPKWAATAAHGFALLALSPTYTNSVLCGIHFEE
jgi:hypothetical protein